MIDFLLEEARRAGWIAASDCWTQSMMMLSSS